MLRTTIVATLLSVTLLILATVGMSNSITLLAQEREGLFGQVTSVTTPSPGLTVIKLDTSRGSVEEVEAAEARTLVIIPGRETASATDISSGDFVAVSGARVGAGSFQAIKILVKPGAPVAHAHITGSVVGAVGDQVTIMDRDGNLITVEPPPGAERIDPTQVVTAVVRQDLRAGTLSILAAESADVKIERLRKALESAANTRAQENQKNLGERLRASTTGHLTTLQEIGNRVDPNIGGLIVTPALERSRRSYQDILATFGLGRPTMKLAGVIQDIDRTRGVVFVSPQEGPQVQLKLSNATLIRDVFGASDRTENLEAGQRIESVYDPQTGEAQTINVVFPTLELSLVRGLLAQTRAGELEGTVIRVDPSAVPPVVVVRQPNGTTVSLSARADTRIQVREEPSGLTDLVVGKEVKVRHDPSTTEALDIETFDEKPDQAFISGVVKSFIPKIRPGIRMPGAQEEGNISVTSLKGETITLNITAGTVIERDGLKMNIGAVKLGDLVRPVTRYNTGTREVLKLVLKTPELRGTVRGKITTPGGRDYLTISTDELGLVTIALPPTAKVTRADKSTDFAALKVGERVASGLYNPVTLQATQLEISPPKTLRIAGTVSALDQQLFILTVTPPTGEPLQLLVPNKPGIITRDGNPKASFSDLKVGDKIQVALYRPNRVVVSIVVKTQ